jgi:ABC-2 type transport system permease protein
MNKILAVALREFRQKIRNRGFLLTSIATPLILLVLWAVGSFAGGPTETALQELGQIEPPDRPLGYVDQAGLIETIPAPVPGDLFQAYPDVEAARTALEAGEIEAYYRVPADYRQTGRIYRVSPDLPTVPPDTQLFNWVLVGNLLATGNTQEIARMREPFNAPSPEFVNLTEGAQETTSGEFNVLPFLVTVAVIVPLFTSGSYLFQSLVQEKDNRIMEILLSSLRPRQLLAGKLLGLGALTAVQYAIWIVLAGLVLSFTGRDISSLLSGISLTAGELLWAIPFALGGFLLYAALMAGIGALSPDMESSRAWVFVLTLPMMLPLWFWALIAGDPNGPLAAALSLFPFSAPVAMLMRMTSTAVPTWQLGLSVLLLLLSGVLTIWIMAHLFRVQTLLSGESFSLSRAWSALTG